MSVLVGDRAPSAEQAAEFRRAFGCAAQIPDQLLLTATVTNPLSDIARSNEPVRIGVTFDSGVISDLSRVVVKNQAGQAVPWQWEPCRHARTDADISRWPNGSYKAGYIWVMLPSLAAGASTTYTIGTDEAASLFAPAVVFSQPDGSTDRIETADYQIDFTAAWTYGLKNLVRKSNSKNFFLGSSSGVDTAYKHTNAGTANYSGNSNGTGAPLTNLLAKGVTSAGNFGNGVVFLDYQTRYNPQVETRIEQRQTYRIFANGKVELLVRHIATASVPSTDLKIQFSTIRLDGTGLSATASVPKLQVNGNYGADGALQVMCQSAIQGSDVEGAIQWDLFPAAAFAETAIPRVRMGGQRANYVIPAGAERRHYYVIWPSAAADFDNDELRNWNALCASASAVNADHRFDAAAKVYLAKYRAYSVADTGSFIQVQKVAALMNDHIHNGTPFDWGSINAAIDSWNTYGNRGPEDSGWGSRQFAAWKTPAGLNNLGWQFVGRDIHALDQIATEAAARGYAAIAQRAINCIAGISEFARLCWVDNGSTGRIVLDSGNPENLNATAEAAMAIAHANKYGVATAAQMTALDSIWAALLAGFQFRNWPPYTFASNTYISTAILLQVSSYFHRVTMAIDLVPKLTTLTTNISDLQCLLASSLPSGQVDEWEWNYNYERRGSFATYLHFAVNFALYGGDGGLGQAMRVIERVNAQAPEGFPSAYPMDGWLNGNARGVGDAFCAMLMGLALRRS